MTSFFLQYLGFCAILRVLEMQLEMNRGGEEGLPLLAFVRYFQLLDLSENPMTQLQSIQITSQ